MILLDTDTCIAILRGSHEVIERRRARSSERAAIAFITEAELRYGAEKSRDPQQGLSIVDSFVTTLPVLGPDPTVARTFGRLKAELEKSGRRLADHDLWIAAVALRHEATLITGNVRHFSRITDLSVEKWLR